MNRIFVDDFVTGMGFPSTEEYIESRLRKKIAPQFNSVQYFSSLHALGLIGEGFSIRTSKGGVVDEHYSVDADGNLVGVTEGPYPGEEGTFRPEEILAGERISSGWTIESVSGLSYLFRRRNREK